MSITIKLMKNRSDTNVLDKELIELLEMSGTFREETSILNPDILIEGAIPTDCNYMYIPDFSRYYYVNDITSVRNNLYRLSGHVDVLKTYATQIRSCEAIVARQQSKWNLYIDDGTFKVYQNEIFKIMKFPSGFSTQEFVLAVAGG